MQREEAIEIAKRVSRSFRRKLRPGGTIEEEDLFSEALVAALQETIVSHAYVRARFAVLELFRQEYRQKDAHAKEAMWQVTRTTHMLNNHVDEASDIETVLLALTPEELAILRLRFIQQRSRASVAKQLGITRYRLEQKEEHVRSRIENLFR